MPTKYLFKSCLEKPKSELFLENNKINIEFLDSLKDFRYNAYNDTIEYEDLWENTDLNYQFLEEEIKETIRIRSINSPKEFNFKISGYKHCNIQNNVILFFDSHSRLLYSIKPPFIITNTGEQYSDHKFIYHDFNIQNGIYTIKITTFDENCYPLIIDPTFSFSNSMPNNYIGGTTVSAAQNSQIILTGSDSNQTLLSCSNAVAYTSTQSKILGNDIVSFHKNVNAYLEFMDGSKNLREISEIKVISSKKTKTIIDKETKELLVYITLSPTLLYAVIGDADNPTYTFTVTLSNSALEAIVTVTGDLTQKTGAQERSVDKSHGQLVDAVRDPSNKLRWDIIYIPPTSLPESEADRSIILRVKLDFSFTFGDKESSVTRYVYSSIQLTTSISKEPFEFRQNAGRTDWINGDYYAPTSNRGLVIIDISQGLLKTIDTNNGLNTENKLNVYCAGRLGNLSTIDDSAYRKRGLLICTADGIYLYTANPYAEPASYTNGTKLSSKVMIDFVMSGDHVFFLDAIGTIYRVNYKALTNENYTSSSSDILSTVDHQPFYYSHFYQPTESTNTQSPYRPEATGYPTKLLPISISQNSSSNEVYYVDPPNPKWNGISFIYTEITTGKKLIMSIAYANASASVGTSATTSSDKDKESFYNKVVFTTCANTSAGYPYYINQIAKDDKMKIVFDWEPDKTKKTTNDTWNYLQMYIPHVKYATSRVVVGGLLPDTTKTTQTVMNLQPSNDKFYLCPRNISIAKIQGAGKYYDPITGEEVR